MESLRSGLLVSALMIALFAGLVRAAPAEESRKPVAQNPRRSAVETAILGSVNPSEKDWVKNQILHGRPVVLTNSYLFQVMKCTSQQNQMQVEEHLLVPLLKQVLTGMLAASTDPDSKRLFSVALLLLSDKPAKEVSLEAVRQAELIASNPLFKPRGHYTDSEVLKHYFLCMQYLAKATIDVSINREFFPFPEEMLFPFETVQHIRKMFADPANKKLLLDWTVVHAFYANVNGPSDLPTFLDVHAIRTPGQLTKEHVTTWARENRLPRINPERGVGIQPLGERFCLHEYVIDTVRRQLMKGDTPKPRIAELLAFKRFVQGYRSGDRSIKGFDETIAEEKGRTYYLKAARAISLGAQGWQDDPMRLNSYASSLTALAEQTVLMTKTSVLVRKSALSPEQPPDNITLYLEPDSEHYIRALAKAASCMNEVCERVQRTFPGEAGNGFKLTDSASLLTKLAEMAKGGKSVAVNSPAWKSYGDMLAALPRKPAATVDVFQLKERGGKASFFQWAIAPFYASYTFQGPPPKTPGLVMVFFEGWNDEMVPNARGPLSNLEWENRILEGNLTQLRSIVPIPQEAMSR